MNLSPEALEFLIENAMRNDREWFQANKERFRQLVIAPLEELVSQWREAYDIETHPEWLTFYDE